MGDGAISKTQGPPPPATLATAKDVLDSALRVGLAMSPRALAEKALAEAQQPPPTNLTQSPIANTVAKTLAPTPPTQGTNRPESFPFSAGANGQLSPVGDFKRFLALPDPTEKTLASSRPMLFDYMHTGQFGEFAGDQGVAIRYIVFAPPPGVPIKGVINLVQGTRESMAKYAEFLFNLRDLRAQGYVIATMDHRGQGFSGKEFPDRLHIENRQQLIDDEIKFREILVQHFGAQVPYTAIGHSLGAAVAAREVEQHPDHYRSLILLAPMLNMQTGHTDTVEKLAAVAFEADHLLTHLQTDVLGQASAHERAPGETAYNPALPFDGNGRTHSRARFAFAEQTYRDFPDTQIDGITRQWFAEGVKLGREVQTQQASNLSLAHTHILLAKEDSYVENHNTVQLADRLELRRTYWPSKHELLHAPDDVRTHVMNYLRQVITGQL